MADPRRLVRRALGLQPLTPTGFVAIFASFVALYLLGMQRVDLVLVVAGMAGVVLLVGSFLLTGVGAVVIARRARATPTPPVRGVVGVPSPTGFVVAVPLWLPMLDLRWTVLDPVVEVRLVPRGRALHEEWLPVRRGTPARITRELQVGDVFGLWSIRFELSEDADLRFLPSEGSLRRVEVIQGLAAGDQIAHPDGRPVGDLQDMRQYGAGDPIRYVLWKVFAKSRTLVVRTPERALAPVTRTAAYLLCGPTDQAAAGTAKTAIECGALGDQWVFGANGTPEVARDRAGALPILLDSASATDATGLGRFLQQAENPRRLVVFTPPAPGDWVREVLSVARTTHVEVVICVDSILPSSPRVDVRRLFLLPTPPPTGSVSVDREALAALCTQLSGVGEVRIVDRVAGVVYAGAHITKLTRGAA